MTLYQVMDWAKRQALAHHKAEEKGDFHLWLLSLWNMDILIVDIALVNIVVLVNIALVDIL